MNDPNVIIVPKEQLADFVGKELGPTDWVTLDQDKIDTFADVTLDHQFIHVDPEAAAKTPFGGTIAHGYLTLSMLAYFQGQMSILPEGTVMGVNYGLNKVRFLQPVRAGKRVRCRSVPQSFEEKKPGQFLCTFKLTIEIEGEERPALIAEALYMSITG